MSRDRIRRNARPSGEIRLWSDVDEKHKGEDMALRSEDLRELIELLQGEKEERDSYRAWREEITERLEDLGRKVAALQEEAAARRLLLGGAAIISAICAALSTIYADFIRPLFHPPSAH